VTKHNGTSQLEDTQRWSSADRAGCVSGNLECRGMAMVELIVAGSIAVIVIASAAILIDGGNRAWLATYDSVNGRDKDDATTITAAFTQVARKSNRTSYVLYNVDQGRFRPITSDPSQSQAVVAGDAVELRYWDVELEAGDSHDVMDTDRIATAYALFYIDDGQFKVDYGPYRPGAISDSGQRRTTNVDTVVLADNVSADSTVAPFSHTAQAGVGLGCIRLNVLLTDPTSHETTRVMTAALMRNIWPR